MRLSKLHAGTASGMMAWVFRFILVTFLICFLTAPAEAQRGPYPAGPVKVILGYPPGGGIDVAGRLISQKIQDVWGQPMVVENRPGAGTAIATRFVAGATPDGYTVLLNSNSMLINQIANPDAGYDVERQLIPVINICWQPMIIAAAKDLPVSSLEDIFTLSKSRKLTYGSPGQASIPHLAAAWIFDLLRKTPIIHVPYKGAAPAFSALAGNQIELAVATLPPAIPLVKAGRIKPIAVTSAKRTVSLPQVPTVAESGFPGYEVNAFSGYFMPVGTPKAVIDTFHNQVAKVLAMPDVREKLATMGFEQADPANENFPRIVSAELKQWVKVVKEANIKIQ